MIRSHRVHFLLILVVVATFTTLWGSFWPPVWPDEALFSSPAASLAADGRFITPVLSGLIPGMDVATLWNSPLYMVLLSMVYLITGESLLAGRLLSLFLAFGVLSVFRDTVGLMTRNRWIRILSLWALALDLTFLRAANTIRMDVLALLFFLLALRLLIRYRMNRDLPGSDRKQSSWIRALYLAGIFTGLAGASHPFAVILVPIWALLILPDIFPLFMGFLGAFSALAPWLTYIMSYPGIFQIQFLSQMGRKAKMAGLTGGDTGGSIKVFASQYGELGAFAMLGVLLLFLLLFLFSILPQLDRIRSRLNHKKNPSFASSDSDPENHSGLAWRMIAVAVVVFSMILASSEGWYAVYASPIALLMVVAVYSSERERSGFGKGEMVLLLPVLFFLATAAVFVYKKGILMNAGESIDAFHDRLLQSVAGCKSLYSRGVPDPYFRVRKKYPEMRYYEFIPGKLTRGVETNSLKKTYDSMDCFLLDGNDSWEPGLSSYLEKNRELYRVEALPSGYPPGEFHLWKKSMVSGGEIHE